MQNHVNLAAIQTLVVEEALALLYSPLTCGRTILICQHFLRTISLRS